MIIRTFRKKGRGGELLLDENIKLCAKQWLTSPALDCFRNPSCTESHPPLLLLERGLSWGEQRMGDFGLSCRKQSDALTAKLKRLKHCQALAFASVKPCTCNIFRSHKKLRKRIKPKIVIVSFSFPPKRYNVTVSNKLFQRTVNVDHVSTNYAFFTLNITM